ncbi:PLP-dependent aminotransferase family protein [Pseudonocardia eucalypti]|uniref:PLP-dependent aminotransferase family protein n=1 Tax=Pseudonocardia eucalypti TaxID=648755 RepID=A0ABP9Q0G3_9PSEU|nr:GntR family transcriptional regulator/MocR family aminotransferase [Pseudonocardia eucalypti]
MTDECATSPGADLHLDLAPGDEGGLRAGLMEALREAVRTGRLARGARLPSSRSLATDLGIARNTVVDAYSELVAEGWLTAHQGSGTRVANWTAPQPAAPPARPRPNVPPPVHDLQPGRPDVSSFPRTQWSRSARRALMNAPDEALGYADPRGRIELRTSLAGYLARARGVRADPDRIVVCSGAIHGLMLLGAVLRARGWRAVAVESYGLGLHRNLFVEAGLRTPAIGLDEGGARVEELADVGAVLLTPAHQFPTGVALHPRRRAAVLSWARSTGGFVIEDDYDGEFRYDRQPVGALQGMDPERVVYLGTTSKTLAPGLRLGWMVLPEELRPEVERAKGEFELMCGFLDQLTLADLIDRGAYDQHIRTMRLAYRRRRDQLVEALAARADVRVTGLAAGLHAILRLPEGGERAALHAAAWRRLELVGLDSFRHPDAARLADGLVVGYATPSRSAWSGALQALRDVLP